MANEPYDHLNNLLPDDELGPVEKRAGEILREVKDKDLFNAALAWQQFKQVVPMEAPPVRKLTRSWIKYAAALLLPALAVMTWYMVSHKRESIATEQVSMKTIEVPWGKISRLPLADGSVITINAGSALEYPAAFGKGQRRVRLLYGEVFCEIAKDKSRPFIISSNQQEIEVTGTSFNVRAYTPDAFATTLLEGSVVVRSGADTVPLKPGEQVLLDHTAGMLQKTTADAAAVAAWKEGVLYFNNTRLEEIAQALSRKYNCRFDFAQAALKDIHLTFDLDTSVPLAQVLDHLEIACGIDCVLNNGSVLIRQGKN